MGRELQGWRVSAAYRSYIEPVLKPIAAALTAQRAKDRKHAAKDNAGALNGAKWYRVVGVVDPTALRDAVNASQCIGHL